MNGAKEEIESLGVKLVFIGQATPRHAAHFQRRYAPDIPILADEDRASYKAMGLRRGTASQLIGPKSVLSGLGRVASTGGKAMQGRVIGDAAQLGGTFLVMPSGEIAWAHVNEDASDNADIEAIETAVREATKS